MKRAAITPAIVSERYELWGVTSPQAGWPSKTQPLSHIAERSFPELQYVFVTYLLTLSVGQVIHHQIIR